MSSIRWPSAVGLLAIGLAAFQPAGFAWSQSYRRAPDYTARRPTIPEVLNRFPAKTTQPAKNDIIQPIPLTARRLESAKEGVAQQIRDQVADLRTKIRALFPDELDAISETGGWSAENRNALTKALKAVDPVAVYAAWLEAEPNNASGAERIARQTAVERAFNMLEQHAQKDEVEPEPVVDLADELGRLAKVQPLEADLTSNLQALGTWAEIRQILESVEPEPAPVVALPTGKVRLIFNPNLAFGSAIVLNDTTVMVGSRGRGGVKITKGNAAEALGLPVISDQPIANAEGTNASDGVLLINPKTTGASVRYVLNGSAYTMEPGMSQTLPASGNWSIEFDRGSVGFSRYVLPAGTYRFSPTETGWELYRHRYDVTIDNSRNPRDFQFIFDNERMVVRAGHTKELSSSYPIVLRYDRGDAADPVRKKLNQSGTVEVAVNAADNHWDIFLEEGNAKRVLDTQIFER
jgi:hypothetical protein